MSEAYDGAFLKASLSTAKKLKITMTSGVYVGLQGPTYETPAEVRFLKIIGAQAVGMSTVPEVIAANHFGIRVCGISCITNAAAGLSKAKLSHSEVTDVTKQVEVKFKQFIGALVKKIEEILHEPH
jgi:purine-nucleoside phosphorylase